MSGNYADLNGCNQVRATLPAACQDTEHIITAVQLAEGTSGIAVTCLARNVLASTLARHYRGEPEHRRRRDARLVHRCDLRLPWWGQCLADEPWERRQAAKLTRRGGLL
jgi:hypothetical protein